MLRWLAIAGLVLMPAVSFAQGSTNPYFTRLQEGNSIPQPTPVACPTASTPLWNNPTPTPPGPNPAGNVRSISFTNNSAVGVYICASLTCSSSKASWYLAASKGSGVVVDKSVRDQSWSCLGDGGTATVILGIEQ